MINNNNKFICTVGINAGYDTSNSTNKNNVNIYKLYQQLELEEYNKTNIDVSCNIQVNKTVYRTSCDCPVGGEFTYLINGVNCNDNSISNADWQKAVTRIVKELKRILKQDCILLEFTSVNASWI